MKSKSKYGWIKQTPDHRDFMFAPLHTAETLPLTWDLRPNMPSIYDQKTIGSCVGNSVSAAFQYEAMKQKEEAWIQQIPYRLFVYYNARVEDGNTTISDSGATIRSGIKGAVDYGVCLANDWPYLYLKNVNVKPSKIAYDQAIKHEDTAYYAVNQDLVSLKSAIVSGSPIVFGISVYESFESAESASTGIISMPAATESLLGGHAILLVGFLPINNVNYFIFRNSWGNAWGAQGYGFLPESYVANPNLASDFWVIKTVA